MKNEDKVDKLLTNLSLITLFAGLFLVFVGSRGVLGAAGVGGWLMVASLIPFVWSMVRSNPPHTSEPTDAARSGHAQLRLKDR